MSAKIKVLIVDDSSIIRNMYTKILSGDPEIEVVGTAIDPYVAREKLVELKPDVMTLDIEMPRMDGLTFLEAVMKHMPIRTIVISSLSTKNSELALRALELGAIDVMTKPSLDVSNTLEMLRAEVVARVKAVAKARLGIKINSGAAAKLAVVSGAAGADVNRGGTPSAAKPGMSNALSKTTHQILAIASSTGGTEALKAVLPYLPADIPGTLIVQHMPPVFTNSFANALQKLCRFEVREAKDGDRVHPGLALIAPGNFHMELVRSGAYYYAKLHQEPQMHGVRPAADYLMKTVAKYAGKNALGVVLTGMGKDGAAGLLAMRQAGAYTIAQNEETSVVFGMPKEAIECGGAEKVLPLDVIANDLAIQFKSRAVA
jgi:two-component system chemotaxis response regulator CheB